MIVVSRYPGYSVSGQGQQVLVNINVILISIYITGDKHFHISDVYACKHEEVTTLFRSTTL